jgi:hypothetical protein
VLARPRLKIRKRLPPVPALGHVMRKAGNHHAGKARHLRKAGLGMRDRKV